MYTLSHEQVEGTIRSSHTFAQLLLTGFTVLWWSPLFDMSKEATETAMLLPESFRERWRGW